MGAVGTPALEAGPWCAGRRCRRCIPARSPKPKARLPNRSCRCEDDGVGRDVDRLDSDAAWDRDVRNETATERLDRNWSELLQELRVVQTGVQLLTGFLLTLPFQQRFSELSDYQRGVYLIAVGLSAASTVLLIAPVSLHRLLFRRHARLEIVSAAHRFALGGLALLGLAVTGVILLIFDVVIGHVGGTIAGACAFALFTASWALLPWWHRARIDHASASGTARTDSPERSPTAAPSSGRQGR